ncbi:uncharacterized protein LOC136036926 isoform X2 [Artemia franciscana]|uniref:Uncharacterized protein n=1 Tax=Artemia franciscana TaxID=6661 RepID=A0AA88HRH5_ARTSF|nr:hypothetical protein QYM36_010365 [Artemia franciscana]
MEDITSPLNYDPNSFPKLENLALEGLTASFLGDLSLKKDLIRRYHCFHEESSILSSLGLTDPKFIDTYVRHRLELLPGLVGEKFREHFLRKFFEERHLLSASSIYDLFLFESLTEISIRLRDCELNEVQNVCHIVTVKAPNLRVLKAKISSSARLSDFDSRLEVLFKSLGKLKCLESLTLEIGVEVKPHLFSILGVNCPKLKHIVGVPANMESTARLLFQNPEKIFPGRGKSFQKMLKTYLKDSLLTPLARNLETLIFEDDFEATSDIKFLANILFSLPNLRKMDINPGNSVDLFRSMNSNVKKFGPIRLETVMVKGGTIDTLQNIKNVAPNIGSLELSNFHWGKRNKMPPAFKSLRKLRLELTDKNMLGTLLDHLCPYLTSLCCVFTPLNLNPISRMEYLKELELYPSSSESIQVPQGLFQSIERFLLHAECGNESIWDEIIHRPGSLKEIDIQCLHGMEEEEKFQKFAGHGQWKVLNIQRCEGLTLSRVFDLLKFNPGLKSLTLPGSFMPEKPMTEEDAKLVEVIRRHCWRNEVSLKIQNLHLYHCRYSQCAPSPTVHLGSFINNFGIDIGYSMDSDDGEDDDPDFFDMLQRAMVGDYDVDDIYSENYDSDEFSF